MKTPPTLPFKNLLSASLILTLFGMSAGCTVASPGYGNQPIYQANDGYKNANYNRARQQLRKDLRRQGYQLMDIRPDTYRGKQVIKAYAKKNNQAYELTYSYPNLKLLNSNKRQWEQVWRDNDHKNGNKKYKKNNRYDDVEDRIKQESRYSAVRQRAIKKVSAMGYRVKDIELDERNNRGVFEIEAKKGSQEYEILLSYPNLNVIKIEKD